MPSPPIDNGALCLFVVEPDIAAAVERGRQAITRRRIAVLSLRCW
jgi:hypothetical protein